jgi:tetratricopeptide (TPR) repeat protein
VTRALVFAVLASLSVPARAGAGGPGDAEQLYNQGQAAFDAKRYDDALVAWQKSFDLSHEAGLQFNLAQAYRLRGQKGDCASAATAYRKFIAQDPMSSRRPIAERFAADSEKCAAAENPVSVTATAPEVPPNDPGTAGSPASGRGKRIAGLALVGGGALLVATGFYVGHTATALGDEVTSACTGGCDWAVYGPKDADGRRAQRNQYIFHGLGVAAVLGGSVLYWLGSRERAPSRIAIVPRVDGAAVAWSGSW